MKTLMITLLLLISSSAMALDACYTGSWYDPEREGEGINIEINGDTTVSYYYTFDRNDRKAWYTLLGQGYLAIFDTVLVGDKYDDFRTETFLVGSATIEALTQDAVYFTYRFDLEYKGDVKYECITTDDFSCTGSYLYRRITQPIPCPK